MREGYLACTDVHMSHEHAHAHVHDHGHSHGLVAILGATALAQVAIFLATGSVALLADLIHNFGDAATAIPLGSRS